MKRNKSSKASGWGDNKSVEGKELLEFLKEFVMVVNEGIHDDLEDTQDYIEKHELSDYLGDEGLDMRAMEQNEDLTVEDVVNISINFARSEVHRNWHEAMDAIADKQGLPEVPGTRFTDFGKDGKLKPKVEVVGDMNDLPPEVIEALTDTLSSLMKKTKPNTRRKPPKKGKK